MSREKTRSSNGKREPVRVAPSGRAARVRDDMSWNEAQKEYWKKEFQGEDVSQPGTKRAYQSTKSKYGPRKK